MRIHRVYTPQVLEAGQEVSLDGRAAHYLGRVLRVTQNDAIVLFNGDGHDYATQWVRVGKGGIVLLLASRLPGVREPGISITVVQAISRGERMDQTLQKCTELGATRFQPLLSERVEVKLRADKLNKRMEHWRGVVISACEQSGRAVVPEIGQPLGFYDWLTADPDAFRLVLVPAAQTALARMDFPAAGQVVIGPEGGFSIPELEQMASHGVKAVSLGPRVLRTETAAPAAIAVIQARAGDFK